MDTIGKEWSCQSSWTVKARNTIQTYRHADQSGIICLYTAFWYYVYFFNNNHLLKCVPLFLNRLCYKNETNLECEDWLNLDSLSKVCWYNLYFWNYNCLYLHKSSIDFKGNIWICQVLLLICISYEHQPNVEFCRQIEQRLLQYSFAYSSYYKLQTCCIPR
jgi:hypothetical protein